MTSIAYVSHDDAQPDLVRPSSPRPSSRRASASRSSSSTSLSEAFGGSSSESDSEEEEGVFFGTHQPKEAAHVAQLSSIISTPTRPLVRKRDSKEFLRRKTLLLSARKANAPATSIATKDDMEKEWSGGFYVKGARPRAVGVEDDSDDEITASQIDFNDLVSPSAGEDVHCDLTFDFAKFQLHDATSPLMRRSAIAISERTGSQEDSDVESGSEDENDSYGDSDKENNEALVSPSSVKSDRLPLEERPEFLLALGKGVLQFDEEQEDGLRELNMGGLRLTDFSDPDSANGDESQYDEGLVDLGFSSAEEEQSNEDIDPRDHTNVDVDEAASVDEDTDASDEPESQVEEGSGRIELASPAPLVIGQTSVDDSFSTPNCATSTPTISMPVLAEDVASHLTPSVNLVGNATISAPTTPLETSPTHSSCFSGSDLDSPLPVARAPDVIPQLPPHLARSIRAESGSPYRALPPSVSHDIAHCARDDTTLALPTLAGSPATPSTSRAPLAELSEPFSTPPLQRSTLHTGSIGGKARTAPPFKVPASAAGPSKTLARSVNAEKNVAARVGKIKSQLDSVFVNRLGPPQRSASGASSTSSSSNTSTRTRPLGMSTSVSAPSRPSRPTNTKQSEQIRLGSTSTSSRPVPKVNSSQNTARMATPASASATASRHRLVTDPKPFAASSNASTRQPLAPRLAPPASQPVRQTKVLGKPTLVRPGAVNGRQIAASISGSAALSPPHASINPLKRPLPTSQPTLGRAAVSTALTKPVVRPASALPARATREATTVGVVAYASAPVFHPGVEPAGIFRTTLKSPPRLGTLKPGETPRKLGTPMRLATPCRARSAATPLGKAGLNGSSPVRPSAALLLGTPGRPTRIGRGGEAIHPAPIMRPPSVLEAVVSPTKEPAHIFGTSLSIAQDVKEHPRPAAVPEEHDMTSAPERGSSVDYADVSFSLAPKSSSPPVPQHARESSNESTTPPGSPTQATRAKAPSPKKRSPRKKTTSPEPASADSEPRRPKRSIKPPTAALKPATTPKPSSASAGNNLPGISEKELRSATQRNTDRNTVYLYCTIDRQIVRQPGPRPPSPTSKIRTTADRDEEEKKAGRGERAKRRSARDSDGANGDATNNANLEALRSNVERVERARGPGDDDDYETPARPSKKVKTKHERRVGWDRELVIIRDDGRPQAQSQGSGQAAKSALRASPVELDRFGNVVQPANGEAKEAIKKQKIPVTAVFYEGEEPMPFEPAYITSNQEKVKPASKGRKK